jgi:hypothetical protein
VSLSDDLERLRISLSLDDGEGIYFVLLGYPRDGECLGRMFATLGRDVVRIFPVGARVGEEILAGMSSQFWMITSNRSA